MFAHLLWPGLSFHAPPLSDRNTYMSIMLTYCQKPKLALADKNRHVHHVDILLKGNTFSARQKHMSIMSTNCQNTHVCHVIRLSEYTCPSCQETVRSQHFLCHAVRLTNRQKPMLALSDKCQYLTYWQTVRSQCLFCQTHITSIMLTNC